MKKYQVLPALSDEDFAALKADIAARGVLVPVEYDEAGNVLDGHHRVKACAELGISEWPRLVRAGLSDEEKRQHARQLNLARRHLSQAQKRELIAAQLRETPKKSNRQIAEGLRVSHHTVQDVREEQESIGQIAQSPRETTDGRTYPAERKPPKTKTVKKAVPKAKAAEEATPDADMKDFHDFADEVARDIEIERDERIAMAGAEAIYEENKRLTAENEVLNKRLGTLNEENSRLKRQVEMWKKRALAAGWKPGS